MPRPLILTLLVAATSLPALAIHPAWRAPDEAKQSLWLLFGSLTGLLAITSVSQALKRLPVWIRAGLCLTPVLFLLSGYQAGRIDAAAIRASWFALLAGITFVVAELDAPTGIGVPHTTRTRGLTLVLTLLSGTGFLVATWGLLEHVGVLAPPAEELRAAFSGTAFPSPEPLSFFGNVAKSSEFLLPISFLSLGLWLMGKGRARHVHLLTHIACGSYLALAGTLAGLLAFAAGTLLFAFLMRQRPPWARSSLHGKTEPFRPRLLAISLCCAGLIGMALCYSGVLQRTRAPVETAESPALLAPETPSDRTTMEVRRLIYGSILAKVLPEHLWLGLGSGSFDALYPPYREPREMDLSRPASHVHQGYSSSVVNGAHSDPLEILADSGVLGFLAVTLTLLGLLARAWPKLLKGTWLQKSAAAGLLTLLVCSLVRSPLLQNAGASACFAILLGMGLRWDGPARQERKGSRTLHGATVAAFVCLLALGAIRGFVGTMSDIHLARFGQAQLAGDTAPERLEAALAWDDSRTGTRLLYARVLLQQGEFGDARHHCRLVQERRPYSVEAIGREADTLRRQAEQVQKAARKRVLLNGYQSLMERLLTIDPGLEAVKRNLQRASDDLLTLHFLEVAESLAQQVPNAAENALDTLFLKLPRSKALAARRDAWMQELERVAHQAYQAGRFLVMRKAYETLVAISEDPATREIQIGRSLLSAAATAATSGIREHERFARTYASIFTIRGQERRLCLALETRQQAAATAALAVLEDYPEYKEKPWRPLDQAAQLLLEGNEIMANAMVDMALGSGTLERLPTSRRRAYEATLGTHAQWQAIQALFESEPSGGRE